MANPHCQAVRSKEAIFIVVFRELYPIVQLIMINCFICKSLKLLCTMAIHGYKGADNEDGQTSKCLL